MFAKRLKQLRKQNYMTQKMLADQLGVSQGTVGNWESAKREPDFKTVTRLAELLGTTPGDLIAPEQSETENKLLFLARKADSIPQQERDTIIKVFEDTIDVYLKAKGFEK